MSDEWRPLSHAQLLAQVEPRFLEALTGGTNGPLPAPERSLGPQWVRWVRRNARLGEGDAYGRAPAPTPEQQALLWKLAEVDDEGRRRFGFALISLGKGSGKTPLGGWLGEIDLAGPSVVCDGCVKCDRGFRPNGRPHAVRRWSPDVLIMASSYEQADMLIDEMRTAFSLGPLASHFISMQGLIETVGERGTARRIPATPKRADGSKATTLLVDELHEFDTERRTQAYDVAAGGTAKRRDGLVVVLSTAGFDMDSLLGRLVARARRGEFADDQLAVILEADPELDPELDEDVAEGIRQCNPLAARGVVSVRSLVKRFREMPLYRAQRYFWNRWVPSDFSWLPVGAWDACGPRSGVELVADPSLPTWVGADMALSRDSAAVVTLQLREDGLYQARAKIWIPQGNLIDQDDVDQYLRDLAASHNVQWIAADEAWWPSLTQLENDGLPIFRMPQQGKLMVMGFSKLYQLITNRRLVQDGAPDFADQVTSAAPHSTDRGWTLRKGRSRKRIDACPALAGAVFAASQESRPDVTPNVSWM